MKLKLLQITNQSKIKLFCRQEFLKQDFDKLNS